MLKKNHNLTKEKKENPESLITFYLPTITQSQGKINFKISANIFQSLAQNDEGIDKIIDFGTQCYESYLHTIWDKSIKVFLPSGVEEILLYLLENNDTHLHTKLKEKGFIDKINQNLERTKKELFISSSPIKAVLVNKKLLSSSLNQENIEIFKDWFNVYANLETKTYNIFLEQQISQNKTNLNLLLTCNDCFFPHNKQKKEMLNNLFISLYNNKNKEETTNKDIKQVYEFILLNFINHPELLHYKYSHMHVSFLMDEKDDNLVNFLSHHLSAENKLVLFNQILDEINSYHESHVLLKKSDIVLYDKIIDTILIDNQTCHSIKKLLKPQHTEYLPHAYAKTEVQILNHSLNKSLDKTINKQKI